MPTSRAAKMFAFGKKKKKANGLLGGMKKKIGSSMNQARAMGLMEPEANTYANQRKRKIKRGY